MKITRSIRFCQPGARQGSTLVEVVFSIAIAMEAILGSVNGYILSANRAEWSAYSLAAHSLAMQRLEQVRAAKWDTVAFPNVDQLVAANFPAQTNILDVPISGTNVVHAINTTTITIISAKPPLKMVRIDCVWPFTHHGVFTNTIISYRAPDR